MHNCSLLPGPVGKIYFLITSFEPNKVKVQEGLSIFGNILLDYAIDSRVTLLSMIMQCITKIWRD